MKMSRSFPRERSRERELMDSFSSDPDRLKRTLDQFYVVNLLLTRARGLLERWFISDMARDKSLAYTLLDLGSGGGDLAVWLTRRARKLGVKLHIVCLDHDPRVTAYARERCRAFPEIEVVQGRALYLSSLPSFDYVFANHFLHHLADEEIVGVIETIGARTRRRFLVSDLKRSRPAYFAYSVFAAIFLRNSFSFEDGRLSIRKGFTKAELEEIVALSRLRDRVTLRSMFPFRVVILGADARHRA
ncbi:MAG: methyltransferase domain-containing protein [Spirochaetales bacterium]|nr:methyltransferase domain-containing protein [Spirochaetales bacterium]